MQTWDTKALFGVPEFFEDFGLRSGQVKAIFYEGLPWKGKQTHVLAYYGLPKIESGKQVPAMVLVHGGGGTAFVPWVQMWMDRGYAAIAMDTCGCVSDGRWDLEWARQQRHEFGGPPGCGGYDQVDDPVEDQWPYHAVADVILANSLLRSLPQVDSERIGLTGISWGGFLTCIVAAVDYRFKFAAPVYGCGFIGGNSMWHKEFQKISADKANKWIKLWDPSVFLPKVTMPILWVTGTNDMAFPLDALQKSIVYRKLHGY